MARNMLSWAGESWARHTVGRVLHLKGIVHVITMLTSLGHIDIGEYKKPFEYMKITPLYPVLTPFCTLKISVRSQKRCLNVRHLYGIVRHQFRDFGQLFFSNLLRFCRVQKGVKTG